MSKKQKTVDHDMIPEPFKEEVRKLAKRKLPERFYRALFRNLNEIRTAILERKALIGLESTGSKHGLDFFKLSHLALYNDMTSRFVRVLDKDPASATFWYLRRSDQKNIDRFAKEKAYDLDKLNILADKLKKIRDKTLFHIDKKEGLVPRDVWEEADISHREFGEALEHVFEILQYTRKIHSGKELAMPEYDGSDATKLVNAAQRDRIIPTFDNSNSS